MDSIEVLSRTLAADIQQLNMTGQNLANISTPAYKRQVLSFPDLSVAQEPNQQMIPHVSTALDQGALTFTGEQNHIALDGDHFFAVSRGEALLLTRKGEFVIDANGWLKLASGERVQGISGDIQLEPGSFDINDQGEILQGSRVAGQLAQFKALDELIPLGNGLYRAAVAQVHSDEQSRVRQGFLETSNVNHLHEMVRLTETVRHFEASNQVLQGYNTLLEEAVTNLAQF